ncbi:MAG: replication-associated recombination protein A [Eubacteriales bacterium]|nr:replication-associated recombination protein A [Eubacteriales bacterium]
MQPLAELLRPRTFDEMVGQTALVGENGVLRRFAKTARFSNMIFYGPPGVGKTTAAAILASATEKQLHRLNATTATLADIREVIASTATVFGSGGVLLYLDEIQYFNKKQQQSLLEFLEDGRITLIASTTENPYFYIYPALLSRCAVFEFKPLTQTDICPALQRGLSKLCALYGEKTASSEVLQTIAAGCGGDVRRALGILENAYHSASEQITPEQVELFLPAVLSAFDRDGDGHYDLLSGLQKSIRGSDPDAALFYLAKLLEGGDLLSACRRLQVIASEDIGLAYPLAAVVTQSCVQAARELGLPEASIPLAHATALLATAPKSNAANAAYCAAAADARAGLGNELPPAIRDAHYPGAQALGRGQGYQYPHDFPNHYVAQRYLPLDLGQRQYFTFGDSKQEQAAAAYAQAIRTQCEEPPSAPQNKKKQ